MRIVPFVLSAMVTIGLTTALNNKIGPLPPLGKLLSPSHGLWQNADAADLSFDANLALPALKEEVQVYLDERLVPHVFAQNDEDAYTVQGYLHARFRLWQMEFQTHAAAGRLSEILGPKVGDVNILERADRQFRRLGMVYAAENALAALDQYPEVKAGMEAYARGVNAYINSLSPAQYPIEYKLLDYAPEPWTPLKTMIFIKYMAFDLANDGNDFDQTNLMHRIGLEAWKELYPIQHDSLDPIAPKGTPYVQSPRPVMPAAADSLLQATGAGDIAYDHPKTDPNNGSNNWVVGGSKTASGRPILANDPHLGINLPSLWYEIQLHLPTYNVYGVSFPGAPGVVIGFNDSIAWGITNAGQDVMDFYEVKFKDSTQSEYLYNGEWVPAKTRIETIRIRGKADFTEKIPMTVWGPVMYDGSYQSSLQNGKTYAVRWKAHDPGMEAYTFMLLNRAKNYNDYVEAISHFKCPGQNFVFGSKTGDIAWWQRGEFPAKWKRQGEFVMPGWDSSFAWQRMIPAEENVHMLNPPRGFVSSANQRAADSTYPYYLGGTYELHRNFIINKLLTQMQGITPEQMRQMQSNNYNIFAQMARPMLLKHIDSAALAPRAAELLQAFANWNLQADTAEVGMTVFFEWWKNLTDTIYADELFVKDRNNPRPQDQTLLEKLIKDTAYQYVDNVNTPQTETLRQMVTAALNKTATQLPKNNTDLAWARHKGTRIQHLLQSLTPFSRINISTGGSSKIINATQRTNGPSWRVVVHLTDETEAWGVYPGGQHGNPGSKYYDMFIDTWARGEHYRLWIMKASETNSPQVKYTMKFKAGS